MKHYRPAIGAAIDPREEALARDEAFIARWRPLYKRFEPAITALALIAGGLLALSMLCNFVVAIATGRVAA